MKNVKPIVLSALSSVLALGIVAAAGSAMAAPDAAKGGEKCYGIVKAGKNDCQTATSACAGSSKRDNQGDAWIYVPKGSCMKIVGGSLGPKG